MGRTLAKILYFVIFVVGLVVMAVFYSRGNETLAYITAGITIVGTLFCCYHMRCPHCGRWPRKGDFFAEYCAGCGEPLD